MSVRAGRRTPEPTRLAHGATGLTFFGTPQYVLGMDTLTPKQVRDLADAIHTRYGYLHRVRERMQRIGFTHDNEPPLNDFRLSISADYRRPNRR
jgi:hypothetical protein